MLGLAFRRVAALVALPVVIGTYAACDSATDECVAEPVWGTNLLQVTKPLLSNNSGNPTEINRRPTVLERLVAPRRTPTAEVLEAARNKANGSLVLTAFGTSKVNSQPVTVQGPNGQSSMTFNTNFATKPCETLSASDLPHLDPAYVQGIANMFKDTPAPKPVCTSVFGVLVVVAGLKNSYTGYTQASFAQLLANIVGTILDEDEDGTADDPKVLEKMRTGPGGHWIHAKRTGINKEETWVKKLGATVQVSEEHDFKPDRTISETLRACVEESYHTYQHAREKAYPTIFGMHDTPEACMDEPKRCDWTGSIALRCSALSQCNMYTHDECTCSSKGNGASAANIQSGGCATPSCAGIEWGYNIDMAISNNYQMSHGMEEEFWKTSAAVEAKLTSLGGACVEFVAILKGSQYNGRKTVFKPTMDYTPGQAPVPAPPGPKPVPPAPQPAPQPTPPPNAPVGAGIAACEDQSFSRNQCLAVGCCFFEEGRCWADEPDSCNADTGGNGEGPKPVPPAPQPAPQPDYNEDENGQGDYNDDGHGDEWW